MDPFLDCDIRGIYPDDIDEAFARRLGAALARGLGSGTRFVVAGDHRVHTPALLGALISGMAAEGGSVTMCGLVPTPVYYFARTRLGIDCGVMVTASHNPPEYAGFKPILEALPITPEDLRRLRTWMNRLEPMSAGTVARGSATGYDPVPRYRDWTAEVARGLLPRGGGGMRIVVDSGNGCWGPIAPGVLRGLGFHVEELFSEPDGRFPNRSPDVSRDSARTAAAERVIATGADLGVAYDGDGDRVAFVDNRGRSVSNDVAIVLLLRDALSRAPGAAVVHDIKCSRIVEDTVREMGGTPVPEKSGHTFIKRSMVARQAAFGGELSGHLFFRELAGGDDALYATLRMAALLQGARRDLAGLVDDVPRMATTPDIRIGVEGDRAALVAQVRQGLECRDDCTLLLLDGVRADFAEGWGLLRESVTEPAVTLRLESRTRDDLWGVAERFLAPAPELLSHARGAIERLSAPESC